MAAYEKLYKMLKIITVFKSGPNWLPEYVYNFKRGLDRHVSIPYEFVCLSDIELEISTIPLLKGGSGFWNKIQMFRPELGLTSECLYFDLDTIIKDNIDDIIQTFFQYDFLMLQDPWKPEQSGSGIMWWNTNCSYLWDEFISKDLKSWEKIYNEHPRFGDQGYIIDRVDHQQIQKVIKDPAWVCRFTKKESKENSKILVFAGPNRKPWLSLNHPDVINHWSTPTLKCFVITLIDNPVSLELSQKTILSANKYGINCTQWTAINGMHVSIDNLKNNYGIEKILKKSITQRPGVLGCFLSHFILWLYCVKINESIVILEHDAEFIRSIPNNIVDYFEDVLKLDAYNINDNNYQSLVEASLSEKISYGEPDFNGYHKAGKYSLGAHGYIIKPSGAIKLINFSKIQGILPTDLHIGNEVVNFKSTKVSFVKSQETHTWLNIKELSSTTNILNFGKK